MNSPTLSPDLVERVLTKLGFTDRLSLDLSSLNALYAAFSGKVSNDNIQKRIWLAGDRMTPLTGGDPTEFFENWLAHGTGGTCFPINGAMAALVQSLGFDARRIAGSMILEGVLQGANHGTVVVTLDGVDYLIDAQMASFEVLPLVPDTPARVGPGIHAISVAPIENGFEVLWYTGINRQAPLPFHTETEHDPVDHDFFLSCYDRSVAAEGFSPFNDSLYICRRFPESIVTLGRMNKITIASDKTLTKTEISDAERKRILVEELGISEEIAEAIPPDVPGGMSLL